jgi:hypothetical protein
VTEDEYKTLRFRDNMNILQMVCHEEATCVLEYMKMNLTESLKYYMALHRDDYLGSQAIHLAAATGSHNIITSLLKSFNADLS